MVLVTVPESTKDKIIAYSTWGSFATIALESKTLRHNDRTFYGKSRGKSEWIKI